MTSVSASTSAPSDPISVFISYVNNDPRFPGLNDLVLRLAAYLRTQGFHSVIDQDTVANPPNNWPQWMAQQVRDSTFTLYVPTLTYTRRVMNQADPGYAPGLGVRWEGHVIYGEMYREENRRRFIPILFKDMKPEDIPAGWPNHYYQVDITQERSLTPLLDRLVNHNPVKMPAVSSQRYRPEAARRPESLFAEEEKTSSSTNGWVSGTRRPRTPRNRALLIIDYEGPESTSVYDYLQGKTQSFFSHQERLPGFDSEALGVHVINALSLDPEDLRVRYSSTLSNQPRWSPLYVAILKYCWDHDLQLISILIVQNMRIANLHQFDEPIQMAQRLVGNREDLIILGAREESMLRGLNGRYGYQIQYVQLEHAAVSYRFEPKKIKGRFRDPVELFEDQQACPKCHKLYSPRIPEVVGDCYTHK